MSDTWNDALTTEEAQAVNTALSLRAMGSTEKTIIRAFAQDGKELLLSALFKLVDAAEAAAPDVNATIAVVEEARKRRSHEARAAEPNA